MEQKFLKTNFTITSSIQRKTMIKYTYISKMLNDLYLKFKVI